MLSATIRWIEHADRPTTTSRTANQTVRCFHMVANPGKDTQMKSARSTRPRAHDSLVAQVAAQVSAQSLSYALALVLSTRLKSLSSLASSLVISPSSFSCILSRFATSLSRFFALSSFRIFSSY